MCRRTAIAGSAAIITDAFPVHRRGMAMGVNQVAGIAGSFLGSSRADC
ncbi:hypothetical protein [Acrocarpospora corrugata]|nr:hypothetical protein [Acrocarpospora corrugata]